MADDFYSGFQEIPEFAEASPEDKHLFGKMWAEETFAADPEYFSDEANRQALLSEVRTSIDTGLGVVPGVVEEQPQVTEEAIGEPVGEKGFFERAKEEAKTFAGTVVENISDFASDLENDVVGTAQRTLSRSVEENLAAFGTEAERVGLHTLGIPGRFVTSLAQLPYRLPSAVLEAAGQGDTGANQWLNAKINELEVTKNELDIFKTSLSKYEPDVLLAGVTGGGVAAFAQRGMARALGATELLGTPGYSVADATIVSSYTGATGEALTIPSQAVVNDYIDKSGFSDNTKSIMKMTAPILIGTVSGATYEYRMDKVLGNPLVVNRIEDMVLSGRSPQEVASEVKKFVKAPKLFDTVEKKLDGIVSEERLLSAEERLDPVDPMYAISQRRLAKSADEKRQSEAIGRYFDQWRTPRAEVEKAVQISPENIARAREVARQKATDKYFDSWTNNNKTVSAEPELRVVDTLVSEAAPPRAQLPIEKILLGGREPKINVTDFAETHSDVVGVLAKYHDPEYIERFAEIPKGATTIGQTTTENLLGLTYRIPNGKQWTPEMFDDMIVAARGAEDLWSSMRKAGGGVPSVGKGELLDKVDRLVASGRYDENDGKFISGMVKMLKKEKLFDLLPIRTGAEIGKDSASGAYYFGKNLIKLKDPDALTHEIGHWGFMNGLSGEERIKVLEIVRDKLKSGWVPGENLARQKYVLFPDSPGRLLHNREENIDEYFAEQYSQWVFTNHSDGFELNSIFKSVHRWAQKLFNAMRNEKLVDQDMVPFFERFAQVNKKNTLLFGDVSKFNKSLEGISDIIYDTRTFAARLKGSGRIDPKIHGDPFSRGTSFQQTRRFMKQRLQSAVKDGTITNVDARKLYSIGDVGLAEMLFDPRNSTIARYCSDLGLTGARNPAMHKQVAASLSNDAGFVDPNFLRTVGIHTVPLVWGLEEENGRLHFNANKYLKGAAVWYGLGFGGKFYRKIGGPQGLKRVGTRVADKFWGKLEGVEKRASLQPSLANNLAKFGTRALNSLRPTEGVDPDVWALGKTFKTEHRALLTKLETFAADLKKNFNREEREMISDFIEQEGDWARVPQVLQAQAEEVRGMLKEVREKLVASGVDPKILEKYGDQYLHRVYLPRLANKKTYGLAKQRLKTIQGHYVMRRGKQTELNNPLKKFGIGSSNIAQGDTVYSFLDGQAKKRWAHESQPERIKLLTSRYGEPTKWEVETSAEQSLGLARDYTRTERQAMGESRDVALRLATFFRETSHDITLGHMFNNVKEVPDYVLKVPKNLSRAQARVFAEEKGFEQLPATYTTRGLAKFGSLSGEFVRKDVVKVMRNLTGGRFENDTFEAIWEANRKATQVWKIAKTAYNPATHTLNHITNHMMCLMDGRDPISTVYNGIESLIRKGQFYQDAVNAGLVDSGILRGEWDLDAYVRSVEGLDPNDASSGGRFAQAMDRAWKGVKTASRGPIQLYEWGDEVFKLGVFHAERRAGKSPQEALAAANKLFFDYGDVPSGVAFLRDSGLVPFISYTYKVIPVIARTFVEHPERILAMVMAAKFAGDWVYENEFGKKAMAQKDLETTARPDWQQRQLFGVGPSSQVRLESDPQTGEARFLDIGRYIPGADLFEDTINSFPFGTHPAISLAYGFSSNKHASFGRRILPHDDPSTDLEKEQNLDATLSLLSNTLLPNVPGIPYTYATERVGNALVASGDINPNSGWLWNVAQNRGWTGKNFFGHPVHLGEELATVAGLRVSRTDVPQAIDIKQQVAIGKIGKAEKSLRREFLSHKTTPARQEKAVESFDQTVQGVDTELEELSRLLREAR